MRLPHRYRFTVVVSFTAFVAVWGASRPALAATNCGSPGPSQAILWTEDFSTCDVLEPGSYPASALQNLSVGTSGYFRYLALGSDVWWMTFGRSGGDFDPQGIGVTTSSDWQYAWSAFGSFTIARSSGARRLVDLSVPERATVLQLIQGYLTEAVIGIHAGHHDWHQYNRAFFTGHRGYLAGMEDYFRANGAEQFVPIPTWDPSVPIPDDFTWVKADANGTPRPPLQNLSPNMTTPLGFVYPGCENTDLDSFAFRFEPFHDVVHDTVGGIMSDPHYSPAAAIFWAWHSYIDQLYTNWLAAQWNDCP